MIYVVSALFSTNVLKTEFSISYVHLLLLLC